MAITINSSDLYTESAIEAPSTGILVDYVYQARSSSLTAKVQLTFYASAFAKTNNFARIRELLYAPSPPAFVKLNKVFTEVLTQVQFDSLTPTQVETYIQTYLEGILGVGTVTIS